MRNNSDVTKDANTDTGDSSVDAICAVALIAIAVLSMIYWVINQ